MFFADAPSNWPDPPPTTLLHTLLVFAGIPLLITAVIALLVLAPSLAKGPKYSPGQQWDAEPEWFGEPEAAPLGAGTEQPAIAGRERTGSTRAPDRDAETGGASVRW